MAQRKHAWNRFDVCGICGCHRIWRDFAGYWKFVWENGRSVEPKGTGAPPCEGYSHGIVEACTTALSGAERQSPRGKVVAVLGVFEDTLASVRSEKEAVR